MFLDYLNNQMTTTNLTTFVVNKQTNKNSKQKKTVLR